MEKVICSNRKAYYEYEILETLEAGIQLLGTEVKSLRTNQVSLNDSYAQIKNNEAFMINANIAQYSFGNRVNHEPTRTRKLLLHKTEIARLLGKTKEKGLTLIPLKLYFKSGKAKVELGLGKGKKVHDKRETIKKKINDREVRRAMKHYR
jgi:SsrA-binding protein